jgi:hypothetical protein
MDTLPWTPKFWGEREMILDDFPKYINIRVSTGFENPGKSLNWKTIPGLEIFENQ